MPLSPAFVKATTDVKKLTQDPPQTDKLELYGLFKVARSEDFAAAPKPGMFDLQGKAKLAAWKKVHDEGVKPEEAQKRYVTLVEKLKPLHKFDANKKV